MVIANPPTHVSWFPEGDPLLPENLDLEVKPFLRELDPYQTYDLIYFPKNKIDARLIYYSSQQDSKTAIFVGESQFNHFLDGDFFDFSGYSNVDFITFSNINLNTFSASSGVISFVANNSRFRPQTYITSPLKFFTTEKMLVDRYVPQAKLDWAVNYSAVLYRVLKHYDWGNDNPYLGKEIGAITAFDLVDLDLETEEDEDNLKFTFALEYPVFITYFQFFSGILQRGVIEIKPFEEINLADYKPIAMYSMVINAGSYIDKDLVELTLLGKYLLYSEVMEDFDFVIPFPNLSKFNYFDLKITKKLEYYQPENTYVASLIRPNAGKYGFLWDIPREDFYNNVPRWTTIIDGVGRTEGVPFVDIFKPRFDTCYVMNTHLGESDNSNDNAVTKTEYGMARRVVTKDEKIGRITLAPFLGAGSLFFANNNYWNDSFEFTDITDGLVVIKVPFKDDYVAKDRIEKFEWNTTRNFLEWSTDVFVTYFEDKWIGEWDLSLTQGYADNFNDKLNLTPSDEDYFTEGQTIKVNRIIPKDFDETFTFCGKDYTNYGLFIQGLPPPYFDGDWTTPRQSAIFRDAFITTQATMGSVPVGEIKSTQQHIQEIDERLWEYVEIDEDNFLGGLENWRADHEVRFDWIYVQYELMN